MTDDIARLFRQYIPRFEALADEGYEEAAAIIAKSEELRKSGSGRTLSGPGGR